MNVLFEKSSDNLTSNRTGKVIEIPVFMTDIDVDGATCVVVSSAMNVKVIV
jgi:hypothetical protein